MALLLVFSLMNASSMRRFSPVSVRYDEPFSGQAAYQLRRHSIEQNLFWPTFWHEKEAEIKSDMRSINAPSLIFSGDASLVWHANYLNGAAPGVTDGNGCAVSSTLAFALWGGSDVVGQSVTVDGVERTIRGVFEYDLPLALLSISDEDTGQSFTAIELAGTSSSTTRADVKDFISKAGLTVPDRILIDRPAALASFMAILPLFIFAVYVSACLLIRLKKRELIIYSIVFSVFLGLAFAMPVLFDMLPAWMIPSRFSDFSFWGDMFGQLGEDFHEYLRNTPRQRDVAYIALFFKQIGITFVSVILAMSICFRYAGRRTKHSDNSQTDHSPEAQQVIPCGYPDDQIVF